jgi:hypothetical protein
MNRARLERCRRLLGMPAPAIPATGPLVDKDYRDRYEELTGHSLHRWPQCGQGRMFSSLWQTLSRARKGCDGRI